MVKFLLILLMLLGSSVSAQWKKMNLNSTKDFYDIHFSGPKGYAAGHNSALFKSSDSGKSWQSLALTIPSNLRAVYFISPDTGFVTGENARIQKTTNGGQTWTQKYVRTAAYAYDIQFAGTYGIAIGKDMLVISSSDAGETWTVDTTPLNGKQLNSACITPAGVCWAVGDSGIIIKKLVGQKKWFAVTGLTKVNLNSISSISASVLVAAGGMPDTAIIGKYYNVILKSTDSGNSWNQTTVPEMKTITSVCFVNGDTGFFAGSNGIICRTYDPLSQRAQQLSGTASTLNGIGNCGNNVFICGDGGTMLYSSNRGGYGLGINPLHASDVSLAPQPALGHLHLNSPSRITRLQVTDLSGRSVNFHFDIELSRLEMKDPGMYFLKLEFEDGTSASRIAVFESF